MNEVILLAEIITVFTLVILCSTFLKREGLIAWVAIATVLANVITAKMQTFSD